MIEPQSAQEGASAWAAKVTLVLPMPRLPIRARVAAVPFPLAFAAPLPLLLPFVPGAAEWGRSESPSLAGVVVAVAVGGVPLENAEGAGEEAAGPAGPVSEEVAVPPLNGEACAGAP